VEVGGQRQAPAAFNYYYYYYYYYYWSHWNSNKKLREKFGSCARKTFDSFTIKDSYTWNITYNTEITAVSSSVKLEA
jgi:hypothetical protein